MDVRITSSEQELLTIFDSWRALHLRIGRSFFNDPAFFMAWWDIKGREGHRVLHVATGWNEGRLVALAPLVVARRYGLRILEWGGANVFDYNDMLLEDHADCEAMWHGIRASKGYDVGFIRGMEANSTCYGALRGIGRPLRKNTIYRINLEGPCGAAWHAETLSPSKRKALRRQERQIHAKGVFSFHVHGTGPAPPAIINALIRQKAAWSSHNQKQGLFDDPSSAAALLESMAEAAAGLGTMHLSWICSGDEILAVHFGFIYQNILYYYMPSYHLDWALYSPGKILLVKLIAWCVDHGLSSFDFMKGDDPYKASLANASKELWDFTFAGTPGGWLAELGGRKLYRRRAASNAPLASEANVARFEPVA